MRPLPFAILAIAVALVAGCGGGSSGAASTQAPGPAPAPETAEVLSQFIDAAGAGDVATMWSLLSAQSRAQLGPTQADFARKHAKSFHQGLGSFAGTPYENVLAVEMPSGWGVAAIAGERVRKGRPEYATYAAALLREGDGWKLELGDPVALIRVDPKDDTTRDQLPVIGVRLRAKAAIEEAGLWLDGKPLPASVQGSDGRDVVVTGRPAVPLDAGRHVVIAFGQAGSLAAAGSLLFEFAPSLT